MGTAPLFTSRLPAALRETVMALALLSPSDGEHAAGGGRGDGVQPPRFERLK